MCGIVGFTGKQKAAPVLLDGLSKLEYRGYDSSGLAVRDGRSLAEVVKGVVCDVVMRELNTPSNQLPATTYSESAGNVSQSYTLPNASGAIKLWKSDLKALGLLRQKIDTIDLMPPKRGC